MLNALHGACLMGIWYDHSIDTEDDSTVLVRENDKKVIWKIDFRADMYDSEGALVGRFHLDKSNYWEYTHQDGTVITTGNRDLLKAEMKVFKVLLMGQHELGKGVVIVA